MSDHRIYSDSAENMIEPMDWERFPEDGMSYSTPPEDHDSQAVPSKGTIHAASLPQDHPFLETDPDMSEVYEEGEGGVAYLPKQFKPRPSTERGESV